MFQDHEPATCAFCSNPAVDGVKIGRGKHWENVNEPNFQKVLPGGLHRETVEVSKGAVVCLDCTGGKGLPKVLAAAAAAAREPKSFPAVFRFCSEGGAVAFRGSRAASPSREQHTAAAPAARPGECA